MTKNLVLGGGSLKNCFRPPPPTLKKFSAGGEGLKTETGNFLRHFQNSQVE